MEVVEMCSLFLTQCAYSRDVGCFEEFEVPTHRMSTLLTRSWSIWLFSLFLTFKKYLKGMKFSNDSRVITATEHNFSDHISVFLRHKETWTTMYQVCWISRRIWGMISKFHGAMSFPSWSGRYLFIPPSHKLAFLLLSPSSSVFQCSDDKLSSWQGSAKYLYKRIFKISVTWSVHWPHGWPSPLFTNKHHTRATSK